MENLENNTAPQEETIQLRALLDRCLSKWPWFVVSLAVALLLAGYYILKTPPKYNTVAEVQIKSDSKGKSISNEIGDFSNLGMFTVNSRVQNEVRAFQSSDLMTQVVERLQLYMSYTKPGVFHPILLYGTTLPITAELLDVDDQRSAAFTMQVVDSVLQVRDFALKDEKLDAEPLSCALGDTLMSPIGRIVFAKTMYYPQEGFGEEINVVKSGKRSTCERFLRALQVNLSDKNSEVINLAIDDVSTQRASDILGTLISVYNEAWIKDKNQIANSTSIFITDRLRVIETELAGVDSDISSYKSTHLLPDVAVAASMYMSQSTVLDQQMQALNNQLQMARYIKNYLANEGNRYLPLPANMGINNPSIESQISEYNRQLLERNNLVANSGEKNVLVRDMDQALSAMRGSIDQSIDNEIVGLNTQYDNLQAASRENTARIAANPTQAKQLLSVERQQTVKQALYLFLLQKREENELSQAFTAYNTRVIKHPISGLAPVAPRKTSILLVAFLLGLLLPLGAIYLLEVTDTRVRSRKDLKRLSLPFLGEIPQIAKKSRASLRAYRRKEYIDGDVTMVVEPGNRNIVNEAFRVMRTNLEFMTQSEGGNVIGVTSFNPGSGKSFVTLNLAVSLAIKDKKVLLIDGDLRKGFTSAFFGKRGTGLSDYLAKRVDDVHKVIFSFDKYPTLHFLPIGTVPPNPAELIADQRFAKAIEILRKEYEYIFIDCPPIDIVTDAKIINQSVDRTLFVMRAGLLDKALVPELERLYKTGEYKNLACILNGTESGDSYYGRLGRYGRYGRYGHYGYYGKDSDKAVAKASKDA